MLAESSASGRIAIRESSSTSVILDRLDLADRSEAARDTDRARFEFVLWISVGGDRKLLGMIFLLV